MTAYSDTMFYRDMVFCSDKKCLRKVCDRHPCHLEDNIDNLPVSSCAFKWCGDRIRMKGDEYEELVEYETK